MDKCFLNLTRNLRFYSLCLHEKRTVNGELYRDEVTKTIHSSISRVDQGFNIRIETFDRKHKNRVLSISEKEFLSQAASIVDDIHLKINSNAQINSIGNLTEIRNRAEQKISKLSKSYKGYHAENGYQFLRNFYGRETPVIKDLCKYSQLGLLLNKFYGGYTGSHGKKFNVTCLNLLGHTSAEIEEEAKPAGVDGNEFRVEISGSIISFDKDAFVNEMRSSNILFNRETDKPTLKKYEGEFVFDRHNGTILRSNMLIEFSFGENYNKVLEYTLKEISHEEI